ncbi:MAG TPA: 5-formyltetrahydrofolate cyclo-ligase [Lachnospiraceae bacterium]|nr:5-formyltetrahydrofolate cyclo-ligase [Lachnospiraceae bacterium]
METKREIRKRILSVRDALPTEKRVRSELLMTKKILEHQWYGGAKIILIFVKHGSEIDTNQIIEDSFHQNKKVYIPKIINDTMVFIRVYQGELLTEGYKGILEPQEKDLSEVFCYENENPHEILMIMPGVAFDPYRNRIGYGKGFYDRYLSDKENLHTIAIGFDCQIVSMIESDRNDIKPNQVICF